MSFATTVAPAGCRREHETYGAALFCLLREACAATGWVLSPDARQRVVKDAYLAERRDAKVA